MAAHVCPFCKVLADFKLVDPIGMPPFWELRYLPSNGYKYRPAMCSNNRCQNMVLVITDRDGDIRRMFPEYVGGKEFPDVPDQIAAAANEAHLCFATGAFRASVAMARAVVEATAKDHEIKSGNLQSKIDALAKKGVISEAMRDAAHEIRFAGNEVAHGDLAEEPLDGEDAEEVLGLMDAILLRVYQEPSQVARVRDRRQARKGDSKPEGVGSVVL